MKHTKKKKKKNEEIKGRKQHLKKREKTNSKNEKAIKENMPLISETMVGELSLAPTTCEFLSFFGEWGMNDDGDITKALAKM